MPFSIVLKTIMAGGVDISRILSRKRDWDFCCEVFRNEEEGQVFALEVIVDYCTYAKRIPANPDTLEEFVMFVRETDAIDAKTQLKYNGYGHPYLAGVLKLKKILDDEAVHVAADWEMAAATLIEDARKLFLTLGARQFVTILNGDVTVQRRNKTFGKNETIGGINDAKQFMRLQFQRDVCTEVATLQGDFHENLDLMKQSLLDGLKNPARQRCYTGFPHIDKQVVIGPGQEHRFIGLLGYTNHGKSGFLMTILYNLLRHGKRVLFVPLEFGPMEAWRRLAWLHLETAKKLNLPSLTVWLTNPSIVTEDHKKNLDLLIDDLKNGKTLPGRIEVVHAQKWAEIEDHANTSAMPYDVIAVDYIAHLKYEGRAEKREAISNIFRDAQLLSHGYRDNRGVVIITPLQANKEGVRNAEEPGEGQEGWGCYDTRAVDTFTDATRDLDLIIGVWQRGNLKAEGKTKIHCVKSRGAGFEPFITQTDFRTRYYRDTEESDIARAIPKPTTRTLGKAKFNPKVNIHAGPAKPTAKAAMKPLTADEFRKMLR